MANIGLIVVFIQNEVKATSRSVVTMNFSFGFLNGQVENQRNVIVNAACEKYFGKLPEQKSNVERFRLSI